MKRLIIIRGIPGSGKSTLAKKMMKNFLSEGLSVGHWENDMFFYDANGNYNWEGKKVPIAVNWCFNKVKNDLMDKDIVIVSNTFIINKHIQPYIDLAKEFNANVSIYRCVNDFGNIHNVPRETLENMKANMEDCEYEVIVN